MLVVRLGVWYSFLGRGRIFVCVAKLYSTVEKEGEKEGEKERQWNWEEGWADGHTLS
jgi:hypothetical protein